LREIRDPASSTARRLRVSRPSRVEVEARSYELDPYGHLNNAVYVQWLEHGRLAFLRDRGESYMSVPERHGVRVVVVRTDLSYRREIRLGDRLTVETALEGVGNRSFTFRQAILFPDGTPAAEGTVVMVCTGPDGRAVPVPPALRTLLEG